MQLKVRPAQATGPNWKLICRFVDVDTDDVKRAAEILAVRADDADEPVHMRILDNAGRLHDEWTPEDGWSISPQKAP